MARRDDRKKFKPKQKSSSHSQKPHSHHHPSQKVYSPTSASSPASSSRRLSKNNRKNYGDSDEVPEWMDMPAYAYWDPDFELKQRKKKGNGLRDSKDSKGKGKKTKKGKKMDDGFYCTLRLRTGMTQLLSEAVSEYHSAKRLLELDESSSSDSETEKKDSKKPFIVSKKSCIDDEEKPKEETEFSYPSDLLPSPASSEDESENEYAKWDYDPESVSSRDDDDSDRFCSLGKDDSDGEFVSDEEISESIKAIEEEEEWDATANDQINPPKVEPPHPTLTFLLSIGFPHRKIHQVMEVEDDPIEALVSLIDNEIGTADYSRNQQNLFQVTLSDADIIKKEEKEFLQEVFLSEFVAVDQDHWRVSKKIDVFDDKDLDVTTEIHFRKFSSYPFEAPVIFLSDQTSSEIPTKVRFELTLELNKRAQTSVGEPMIYNLVDWLGSDEAKSISQSIVGTNSISKKSNVLSSKNDNRELADISKKLAAMKISYLEVKDESLIPPEIAPVIAHIPNYIPVSHGTQTISQATSERMFKEFKAQQKSTEFQRMLSLRKQLPSWGKQVEIIDAVRNNRVVVISGETGCGKTTQVPQFILDNYIELQTGAKCKILVTQPRRISAIGVAQRVADERAEVLGKTVGYQIRLESRMSDSTRILFCTTGILLRRLEGRGADTDESAAAWGDGIDDISHIIVDEVHERSLDSDFLLMVLKDLLAIRTDLTLILMSATLNADLFCDYFSSVKPPRVHIEGRTFPVTPIFLEDALIQTHYVPEGDFITKKKKVNLRHDENPDDQLNDLAIADDLLLYENLRKRYAYLNEPVVRSLFTMDTEKIQYPLIAALVVNRVSKMLGKSLDEKPDKVPSATGKRGQKSFSRGRSYKGSKGVEWKDSKTSTNPVEEENRAILIFLPGYDDISNVHETLLSYPDLRAATADGLYCIPLHSSLSSEEQIRVFNRPPSGYVKIIIATNIAETSITVDDVVYVIDSGRLKEMSYDSSKGMSALTDTWVSRSSAMQRRGRAGRVAAGVCVHLFTRHRFENVLEEQQKPEIQRVPLEQLCLRIKVLPFLKGRIGDILSKVIQPPTPSTVRSAITTLQTLHALTIAEELTPLGFHLGRLPVDVRIGKFILFGSIFHCLDPVLTIAAAMSSRTPFMAPFDLRDIAEEKKREFATGLSDHLTILTAYNQWLVERRKGWQAEKTFCVQNFLSMRGLNMMASIKRQLAELLSDIGFIPPVRVRDMERKGGRYSDGVEEAVRNKSGKDRHDNWELIKAVMISALYPHVVMCDHVEYERGKKPPRLTWRTENGEIVNLHPASVNSRVKQFPFPFLIYLEKVKTKKIYIRDSTTVSPYALAFFGGELSYNRDTGRIKIGKGWLQFKAKHKTATIIQSARLAFDELLAAKIENPLLDISDRLLVDVVVQLVTTTSSG